MTNRVYFVSGMDTDCGKTYITARLAAHLLSQGVTAITQKPIQTGCVDYADDLLEHRKVMGVQLLPEDIDGHTCSFLFKMPASPLLAAKQEGRTIDLSKIDADTDYLSKRFERVLVEGAGGLMVPMAEGVFTIDYIQSRRLPLILVASSRLGSINHALLSAEACLARNIEIHSLVYNRMPSDNKIMADDTWHTIQSYMLKHSPATQVIDYANGGFDSALF